MKPTKSTKTTKKKEIHRLAKGMPNTMFYTITIQAYHPFQSTDRLFYTA